MSCRTISCFRNLKWAASCMEGMKMQSLCSIPGFCLCMIYLRELQNQVSYSHKQSSRWWAYFPKYSWSLPKLKEGANSVRNKSCNVCAAQIKIGLNSHGGRFINSSWQERYTRVEAVWGPTSKLCGYIRCCNI